MITIKDLMNFTESFAPLDTQMEFDNSGLLVGNQEEEISKVLLALDITKEVIEEATSIKAQLILSHHPVIFNPIKSIRKDSVIYSLIQNNLSALCLHTNLDISADFGVNTCLADAVGVVNYMFAQGECLLIGELKEETTAKAFAEVVKSALGCEGLRYTFGNKKIKTVAICSGSGGDYWNLAKEYNADLLLTGEIKHNQILGANSVGLAIVDAGHYKTEDIVINPLLQKLQNKFPKTEFIKSAKFTDNIKFL